MVSMAVLRSFVIHGKGEKREILQGNKGRDNMDKVIRVLIERLTSKGIQIDAIPGYVRNMLNVIAVDPFISLEELREAMQSIGWDKSELDYHTYQLVLAIFGPDSYRDAMVRFAVMVENDSAHSYHNKIHLYMSDAGD